MTKIAWLSIKNRHNWRSSKHVKIGYHSIFDPAEFRSKLLEDFPLWIIEQTYDVTPPLPYTTAQFWRHYEYRHWVMTPYSNGIGNYTGQHAYIEEFVVRPYVEDTAEHGFVGFHVYPIWRPNPIPGEPFVRKEWLKRLVAPVRNQNRFYYDTEDRAEEHWERITVKPRYMYPPDYEFDFRIWVETGLGPPGRLVEFDNTFANQKFWDEWAIENENRYPIFYD